MHPRRGPRRLVIVDGLLIGGIVGATRRIVGVGTIPAVTTRQSLEGPVGKTF
jgi:hypothetical protein